MSNSSIWPIDKSLSYASTRDQSGARNDGNDDILQISLPLPLRLTLSLFLYLSIYQSLFFFLSPVHVCALDIYVCIWLLSIREWVGVCSIKIFL